MMKAPSEYFAEFRNAYPDKDISYRNQNWKYIAAGVPSNPPIVLLHGGFVDAAMWAYQIQNLQSDYRIIAPHFPFPPESFHLYCDLIDHIMHSEGIDSASVCGISYGGFIAQYFAKYYPERISRLIVSHNTLPDKHFVKRMKMKSWILRIIPNSLFKKKFRDRLNAFSTSDSTPFHQYYFSNVFSQYSKLGFINGFRMMAQMIDEDVFEPSTWNAETVIFSSKDDTDVRKYLDQLLRAYPNAKLHDFSSGGHHAPMTSAEEYTNALKEYVKTVECIQN